MIFFVSDKIPDTRRLSPQFFKVMKLTAVILTIALLPVSAKTISQVTISLRNAPVERVFQEIERQTGHGFLYTKAMLADFPLVTIKVKNESVDEVLDVCFKGHPLDYSIENNTIIVKRKVLSKFTPVSEPKNMPPPVDITGRVVSQQREPLQNVSVTVVGANTGTTTNNDGRFTLSLSDNKNIILEFSSVGYQTKRVNVGNQTEINVVLELDVADLSDVVVVGYGTQLKKELTGSISSVKSSDFQNIVTNNSLSSVAGLMPGVQITQANGRPGINPVVRVRGTGSISSGNTPLIVVDGLPLENTADFNLINPDDIETIDVLKDAASAAIYGSRGGNGVIIVTTKTGKRGTARFSLDHATSIQQVSKYIDMMDRDENIDYVKETANQEWIRAGGDPSVPNGNRSIPGNSNNSRFNYPSILDDPSSLPNTNWQKEIFHNAPINNVQLSVQGGGDRMLYYISGNYFGQDGIIKGSNFNRYSIRTNIDVLPTKYLKVGVNFSPTYSKENIMPTDGDFNNMINNALALPPWLPPIRSDGYYGQIQGYPELMNNGFPAYFPTPIQYFRDPMYRNSAEVARLIGGAYVEVSILNGLSFRSGLNFDWKSNWTNFYKPSTISTGSYPVLTPSFPNPNPVQIQSSHSEIRGINYSWDNMFTYKTKVGDDQFLTVLAGYSAQKFTGESSTIRGESGSFSNDLIQYVNGASIISGTASKQQWSLVSYLSRINYSYRDKYLLAASIRRDGSSRFAPHNKYATFPAVSAAWVLSKESFLQNSKAISNLKLKGSYGLTGNFNIGNYSFISLLTNDNYVLGSGTGTLVSGLAPGNLNNDNLSWEVNSQIDVGLELAFLNDIVFMNIDWYQRRTKNLLFSRPVPSITGFTSYLGNIGDIENTGLEAAVNVRAIDKALKLNLGINITLNRNKVIKLGENNAPIFTNIPSANVKTEVGKPFGNFFGYKVVGIFRDAADMTTNAQWAGGGSVPGDFKYEDINKDGKIDADDRVVLGNNQPGFTYGFPGKIAYKDFDLNFIFQGVQGNTVLYLTKRYNGVNSAIYNGFKYIVNRWKSPSEPGDGKVQRVYTNAANTGGNNNFNSTWLFDGSYLRLRNLTLGYNIPKKITDKARLNSGRIYLSGQNIFTITKYIGYNPEVSNWNGGEDPMVAGVDYGVYPLARVFTVGFTVGL